MSERSNLLGIRVFSATRSEDRRLLGERITEWLAESSERQLVDARVAQSSDNQFHCLTIVVFYRYPA